VPPDQHTIVGAQRTATTRHPAVSHPQAFSYANTDTLLSTPLRVFV